MIFRNISTEDWLKEWGLETEAQLFFVLRWEEMFNEETYDSWQVRSCNLTSVLQEIYEVLSIAENSPQVLNAVDSLIEEALSIKNSDILLKEEFSFVSNILDGLGKQIDKVKSSGDFSTPKRLIRLMEDNLTSYKKRLIDELQKILLEASPKKYQKRLYTLTLAFAVELNREGYSLSYLQSLGDLLKNHKVECFEDRMNRFFDNTTGNSMLFECIFPVKINTRSLPSKKAFSNLKLLAPGELTATSDSQDEITLLEKSKRTPMLSATVRAPDIYSARSKTLEQLERLFAAFGLYHLDGMPEVQGHDALVYDNKGKYINVVGLDFSRLSYLKGSRNADKRLNNLADVYERLDEADQDRLNAVLQYHRLAISAHTDDARLVNLWIAIESLVRGKGGTIIGRICDLLPFSITTSYLQGVVRNLAIDLKIPWRENGDALRTTLDCNEKFKLPLATLVRLMQQKKDDPGMEEFSKLVGHSPLLRFRICALQDRFFRKPNDLKKAIEIHCKHIDWQLRRIYRNRNYVVHHGTCSNDTRQLIQHLHSYLVMTLYNLVNDLTHNENWSILQAIEFRKEIYHFWLSQVNSLTPEEMVFPEQLIKRQ